MRLLDCLLRVAVASAVFSWTASSLGIPAEEVNALRALFTSTKGEGWRWWAAGPRWNFTEDESGELLHNPCSSGGMPWQGLRCSRAPSICSSVECSITAVSLSKYGLRGRLPSELGDLRALEMLDLYVNSVTGPVPTSLGKLTDLTALYLDINWFTGTLPPEIGLLTNLQMFYAASNFMHGSIPHEIGNLSAIRDLELGLNLFTESIPSEISKLANASFISFFDNFLTGTIPTEVGALVNLDYFYLHMNYINGSIPSEVGNMTRLLQIDFNSNDLSGTIPSEIGDLKDMRLLFLFSNHLTGSIPAEIMKLGSLRQLYLSQNILMNDIPSGIGQLSSLERLYLDFNMLTGTLPAEIATISTLQVVYADTNLLTGSIPLELGNLSLLWCLKISQNIFTGNIPSTLGDLTSLVQLAINHNDFTGPLPLGFCNLELLEVFWAHSNYITNTVPSGIGNLTNLIQLYASSNFLTGDIPSGIGQAGSLEGIDLASNRLIGSVPPELGRLKNLITLDLSSNELTGSIAKAIVGLSRIETINVGDNLMSGEISSALESLGGIRTLVFSVNCLDSVIPDTVCNLESLEVLSMNGLGGADSCKGSNNIPLFDKRTFNDVDATIPSCIWSMRNLKTLHLTGNGFVGNIDGLATAGELMTDVSVSHNRLDGTIPSTPASISRLDVSYNRLTGEINKFLNVSHNDSMYAAQVNRLSGQVPMSEASNVNSLNILQGNIFSCHSIPDQDEHSDGYNCGSSLYDNSMYLMCGIVFMMLVVAVYLRVTNAVHSCWLPKKFDTRAMRIISAWWVSLAHHRNFIVVVVALNLMCVVPVYYIRLADEDHSYSTHWHLYSWRFTFAYMSGDVMGALIVSTWAVSFLAFLIYVLFCVEVNDESDDDCDDSGNASGKKENADNIEESTPCTHDDEPSTPMVDVFNWKVLLVLTANVILTVGVNVLFVLSTTELELSPLATLSVQVSMSMYRMVTTVVFLPLVSNVVSNPVRRVVFRFHLVLFNNFLVPCLATAFSSPNCFRGVLVPPSAVTSEYNTEECSVWLVGSGFINCIRYTPSVDSTAPFVPEFTYNYQCTSTLLSVYVPVFIIGYSLQLFFFSMFALLVLKKHINLDYLHPLIGQWLRELFWIEYWYDKQQSKGARGASDREKGLVEPSRLLRTSGSICDDMLSPLAMLLSFGICSPPLALIICVMSMAKLSMWIFAIKNFCSHCVVSILDTKERRSSIIRPDEEAGTLLSALSTACIPLHGILRSAFVSILVYSGLFVIFLYWDTTSGMSWEVCVAVALFSAPLVALARWYPVRVKSSSSRKNDRASESADETISAIWTM